MKFLNLVFLEDAAVKVGHISKQSFISSGAFVFRFCKSFKEKRAEKGSVVLVCAVFSTTQQICLEIVRVVIQEALLLDEIDEHQAVEYDGNVPALHLFIGNPIQELEKCVVFLFEVVVKSLGDLFNVKGGADTACHIY